VIVRLFFARVVQSLKVHLLLICKHLGYGLDSWSSIPGKDKISVLSIASGLTLGPTQHPIQWMTGVFFFLEIKLLGHEADCSNPSSDELESIGPIPISFPSSYCYMNVGY
jgi:hypothetical protein